MIKYNNFIYRPDATVIHNHVQRIFHYNGMRNAACHVKKRYAISMLRCAALDQFKRTYFAPDQGSRLQKLKNLDDKELFKVIESQFFVFFRAFCLFYVKHCCFTGKFFVLLANFLFYQKHSVLLNIFLFY
jgi:hypothetical protein